jgi:hypothetical protein
MSRSCSCFFALALLLFASLLATVAPRAHAQAGCIPEAVGVPYLNGPPQWVDPMPMSGVTRPEVDDPRWAGSRRYDAPNVGFSTQATVRALNHSGHLFVTMQALVDPNGNTAGDSVWFGFGEAAAGPASANYHLLHVNMSAVVGAGPSPATVQYWNRATEGGSGGWTAAAPPIWIEDEVTYTAAAGGLYRWVVTLRIEMAPAGLAGDFRAWHGMTVNQSGGPPITALYQWPIAVTPVAGAIVMDQNSVNTTLWEDAQVGSGGAPCVGGITLDWNQIGADPPPVNHIDAAASNEFFATPGYGSFSIVANMIKARFRLADWGSTIADKQNAPWADIPMPAAGVQNVAPSGRLSFTCDPVAGANPACPVPSAGNPAHQCMLVELSKVQPGPGSVDAVYFSRDAAARNMEFIGLSRFKDVAKIDIKGLPALASGPERDVFLYVHTRNMPAHGEKPFSLPREQMMNAQKIASAVQQEHTPIAIEPRETLEQFRKRLGASTKREPLSDTLAKSSYEHLASTWPTYEVHAFYDTGNKIVINGETHTLVEPMVPFGYFADHEGELFGFSSELQAQGAQLEELFDNYYRVHIPHGGSVSVNTTIEAHEQPKSQTPTDKVVIKKSCHCDAVGAGGGMGMLEALALALLLMGASLRIRRTKQRAR